MTVVNINGYDMLHISYVAELTKRKVTGLRYLISQGNTIRKLLYYRDRSKLYIPLFELRGYPFITPGGGTNRQIFHYNDKYEKELCPECTFGEGCDSRLKADALYNNNNNWEYGDD